MEKQKSLKKVSTSDQVKRQFEEKKISENNIQENQKPAKVKKLLH